MRLFNLSGGPVGAGLWFHRQIEEEEIVITLYAHPECSLMARAEQYAIDSQGEQYGIASKQEMYSIKSRGEQYSIMSRPERNL